MTKTNTERCTELDKQFIDYCMNHFDRKSSADMKLLYDKFAEFLNERDKLAEAEASAKDLLIQKQAAEIAELKKMVEARAVCPTCGDDFSLDQKIHMAHNVMGYESKIQKQSELIDKMAKALEFYASYSKWNTNVIADVDLGFVQIPAFILVGDKDAHQTVTDSILSGGKTAREALAEYEKFKESK